MMDHVHIMGASGTGTSTLGKALSRRMGYAHIDTDDYYWEPTNPPFQEPRERARRQTLLAAALDAHSRWVLSGSLCGWGDIFIPRFDVVVFLVVPTEVRLARLEAREVLRYGADALAPGGAMHETHVDFLNWAAAYDDGGENTRSLMRHEAWLAGVTCRYVRIEGLPTTDEQVEVLENALRPGRSDP